MEDLLKEKFPDVYSQLCDDTNKIDGMKLRNWTMTHKLPSGNFHKMVTQCYEYLKITSEPKAPELTTFMEKQTKRFEDIFSDEFEQDLLLSYQMIHGVFRKASEELLENSILLSEQDAVYAKEIFKTVYDSADSKNSLQLDDFREVPWFEETAIQDIVYEFLVYCK